MGRFLEAVSLTGAEFEEAVDFYANGWLPARVFVETAVAKRMEADPGGEIIVLEKVGIPPAPLFLAPAVSSGSLSPIPGVSLERAPVQHRGGVGDLAD